MLASKGKKNMTKVIGPVSAGKRTPRAFAPRFPSRRFDHVMGTRDGPVYLDQTLAGRVKEEIDMNRVHTRIRWLGILLCALAAPAQSYSLTGIHDFRPLVTGDATLTQQQRDYPALVYEFEGLTFTQDGSLWAAIAADPAGAKREFWKLDLQNNTAATRIPDPVQYHPQNFLGLANPVGLASNGNQLIVGENGHAYGNLIWAFTPDSGKTYDWYFPLSAAACDEVEGLAQSGGKLYASCQNDKKILEIADTQGTVSKSFTFQDQVLGLEETDDGRLIVGTYPSRELLIFDPSGNMPTETISLDKLFKGQDSDYYRLTGQEYAVQVVPTENVRTLPDPDALAFRDGKIYMAFDGDLRIYEISPAAVPEPETYALMLAGLALIGLKLARR